METSEKWVSGFRLWRGVVVVVWGLCTVGASAETFDAEAKALGVETSSYCHTGFVFVGGRYLEPPYCVARKGFAIFINDQVVREPVREEPVRDLTVTEDPPVPSHLTSTSTFNDISKSLTDDPDDAPLYKKSRWVRQQMPGRDRLTAMKMWFESLPFVASAEELDSNRISVVTKSGERRVFWIETRPNQEPSYSEFIVEADLDRRAIGRILDAGYCCFFVSYGQKILVRKDRVQGVLSQMIDVAQGAGSTEQKIADFKTIGFDNPTYDAVLRELVETFQVTPPLRERLGRLPASAGH